MATAMATATAKSRTSQLLGLWPRRFFRKRTFELKLNHAAPSGGTSRTKKQRTEQHFMGEQHDRCEYCIYAGYSGRTMGGVSHQSKAPFFAADSRTRGDNLAVDSARPEATAQCALPPLHAPPLPSNCG